MKKIIILTLFCLLASPGLALAANDVTITQRTNIILPGDGLTYYLDDNSTFDSFTVNTDDISFTVSANSIVNIVSPSKKTYTVTGTNDYITRTFSCSTDESSLRIAVTNAAPSSYTVTITPSGSCAGGGGGVSSGGGGGGGVSVPAPSTTTTTPAPAANALVEATPTATIANPINIESLLSVLGIVRDQTKETQVLPKVNADLTEFKLSGTAEQKTAMTNFVTYGVSGSTIKLGEGERRAVLRDYLDTVKRAEVKWDDVERITTGQKPVGRNIDNEVAQLPQVLKTFETIVGHRPNFKDTAEDLAWNTMMYRIRFTRDLNQERHGIGEFQATFRRNPKSPLDWATVRALGYALK